jgi:rhamnosyltransferase subunit B
MKILISTVGSHGDILPFIALANEFIKKGHTVVFYANPFFKSLISNDEIKFVEIGTIKEYKKMFSSSNNIDSTKSFKLVASEFMRLCPIFYDAIKKDILENNTIIISSSLLFAGRLLEETHNIPCVTIHLSPCVFRSNINPARLVPNWIESKTPLFIKNISWWLLDKFFYEPNFTKPLNKIRKELGLNSVNRIFKSWIHEGSLVIGLFPEWFAKPQSDWDKKIILADFPLYDNCKNNIFSKDILDFLESDIPIIGFSAGTATATAQDFFKVSIEACEKLGVKAVLLTHFSEQIPINLPKNIIYVNYAPFSELLPKLSLFVHHGGIGSTSQTLKAGIPQIIRPVAFDQFDNSIRAVNLGVAKEILAKDYNIKNVSNVINEMLNDEAYKNNAKLISKNFESNDSLSEICDLILEKFEKKKDELKNYISKNKEEYYEK